MVKAPFRVYDVVPPLAASETMKKPAPWIARSVALLVVVNRPCCETLARVATVTPPDEYSEAPAAVVTRSSNIAELVLYAVVLEFAILSLTIASAWL